MSKHNIQFALPADLKFSSLVRRISEEVFHYSGFHREWAERLKLVVDELFMNAVRYGSGSSDDRVYIQFEFEEGQVTFTIEDEGKGKQKTSAEELKKVIHRNSDEMSDTTKTNGRGLALISSLWTDDMQIKNSEKGGIAIAFTKSIATEAPPSAPPVSTSEEIKIAPEGPKESVRIAGEVDASNMETKIAPIDAKIKALPAGTTLVLDCQDLVYINSTFIGHLAAWLNELQAKQGHLVLKNTNKQIQEVLELVGLSKVIYLES